MSRLGFASLTVGLRVVLVLLVSMQAAWAHKPSDSYITVRAEGNSAAVRWDIALRDLDYVLQIDRDGNGEITWGEVRQRHGDILAYAAGRLSFASGGKACELRETAPMQLDRHSDGTYAVLSLTAACERLAGSLRMHYTALFDVDPTHRGLVQWQAPGGAGTSQALVFSGTSSEQDLQLAAPGTWETLHQYVWEGMTHIWIGYDHILFLLSLLLPAVLVRVASAWEPVDRLKPAMVGVVKVVTAFTLAHSITLSLAALGVISLPSRLVESVIAASVVVAALNNVWGKVDRRRWVMAFVFGLIHGFGFASVLADLGLPQQALVISLVGFNAGVELGQLAIVAIFLPVAYKLRATTFYRVTVLCGGSIVIALLAAWWFVQRAFDL